MDKLCFSTIYCVDVLIHKRQNEKFVMLEASYTPLSTTYALKTWINLYRKASKIVGIYFCHSEVNDFISLSLLSEAIQIKNLAAPAKSH